MVSSVATTIATSAEGTARVIFGRKWMITMVRATTRRVAVRAVLSSRLFSPVTGSMSKKCCSCARKITIARPLTKPSMTGYGTMRMYFPSRSRPTPIWIRPMRMTAGKR